MLLFVVASTNFISFYKDAVFGELKRYINCYCCRCDPEYRAYENQELAVSLLATCKDCALANTETDLNLGWCVGGTSFVRKLCLLNCVAVLLCAEFEGMKLPTCVRKDKPGALLEWCKTGNMKDE